MMSRAAATIPITEMSPEMARNEAGGYAELHVSFFINSSESIASLPVSAQHCGAGGDRKTFQRRFRKPLGSEAQLLLRMRSFWAKGGTRNQGRALEPPSSKSDIRIIMPCASITVGYKKVCRFSNGYAHRSSVRSILLTGSGSAFLPASEMCRRTKISARTGQSAGKLATFCRCLSWDTCTRITLDQGSDVSIQP